MTSRRDFLKTTALGSRCGCRNVRYCSRRDVGARSRRHRRSDGQRACARSHTGREGFRRFLSDARVGRYRRQFVAAREQQVMGVSDSESFGIGVRVLVNGAWGFAATRDVTRAGAVRAAQQAVQVARAARAVTKTPVVLAPTPAVKGTWRTPVTQDPIDVPIEDKVALLLAANEAALKVPGVRFVNSGTRSFSARARRTSTPTAPSDADVLSRRAVVHRDRGRRRRLPAVHRGARSARHRAGNTSRRSTWPERAEMGSARRREAQREVRRAGRYDLILHPTNLWLTIHESIGHPDGARSRAWATRPTTPAPASSRRRRSSSGSSSTAPTHEHPGRPHAGRLARRVGWDDEGVAADKWLIIENGIFNDYQTTREQAPWHLEAHTA